MRRHMSALQWMERLYGVTSGILGVAALLFILFGPLYGTASSVAVPSSCDSSGVCTTTPTSTETHGTASLLQMGLEPITAMILSILLLCLLAIALSAVLHSSWRQSGWLVVLWIGAVLTLCIAALGTLSIGIFILPSGLLALVAAVLGTRVQVAESA